MSKIDDGGQAFPIPGTEYSCLERGMSLRYWFAGQALAALPPASFYLGEKETAESFRALSYHAYRTADAMLAARSARHD